MDDLLYTLLENKQKDLEIIKRMNEYKTKNKKLKEELEDLKKKYAQETEIIIKLDKKIFDLRLENAELKYKIVLLEEEKEGRCQRPSL